MPTLFKYLPPPRITYLDNQLLRFTQPSDLNDPFECMPDVTEVDVSVFIEGVLTRTKPLLDERVAGKPKWVARKYDKAIKKSKAALKRDLTRNPDDLAKRFLDVYARHANETIGVLSLCRTCTEPLMWAHYTESHKGFCIGFDSAHDFFKRQPTDYNDIGTPVDVSYKNERVKIDISEKVKLEPSLYERKDKVWEYEQEVRLIRPLASAFERKPISDGLPVCLFKVPHEAISEIVIGGYASEKTKKTLMDFSKSKRIPVFQSQFSLRKYTINKVSIK